VQPRPQSRESIAPNGGKDDHHVPIRERLGQRAHINSERGASLVEYALLVALIAVVCIAAVSTLGQSVSSKFSTVGASIANG
jgi:pilus assembly protein Flp/PilA